MAKAKTAAADDRLLIDARALKKFLVDLPDGATQGMRREHEGIGEVIDEITRAQKEWGKKAGVTEGEVSAVVEKTEQLTLIRAKRPAVAKLLEMLDETEAKLEDERDTVIRTIAESADAKANTVGPELLDAYTKTRAYRSAPGVKAAKTRKKNAAAAKPAKAANGG